MPSKKNATLVKPLEGSTMIHEESEDIYFRVSQLEKNMGNMEQRMEKKSEEMGNLEKIMEKKLEEGMNKILNLIQHT